MNTTHDDNATTWRDLADQLTPKQVAEFDSSERRFAESGVADTPEAKAALLEYARAAAARNLVDATYAEVPLPPGATTDSESWGQDLIHGGYRRALFWRAYSGGDGLIVDISGWQRTDGSFERHICLWGADEGRGLTGAQARRVAALMTAAADDMERM
jgi:hypothetical protein